MARKQKKLLKKSLWLPISAIAIVAAIILFLIFHSNKTPKATIPSTSPSAASQITSSQSVDNSTSQNSVPSKSDQSAAPASSSQPLTLDSAQTFVSNHHPSSASPAEQSVCNTTPGATCYIQFTQGGSTKTLAAKTADSNGTVIWNWDINSAGLTSGSWQISAVATLNGQTKSASDPAPLEVQ